jgi:hypothetical protein
MYRIVIALSLGLACTLRAADTSDHFSDNGYGKTVSNMYLIGDYGAIGRPTAETSHLGDRLESIKSMPPSNAKAEAKRRKKAALGE